MALGRTLCHMDAIFHHKRQTNIIIITIIIIHQHMMLLHISNYSTTLNLLIFSVHTNAPHHIFHWRASLGARARHTPHKIHFFYTTAMLNFTHYLRTHTNEA